MINTSNLHSFPPLRVDLELIRGTPVSLACSSHPPRTWSRPGKPARHNQTSCTDTNQISCTDTIKPVAQTPIKTQSNQLHRHNQTRPEWVFPGCCWSWESASSRLLLSPHSPANLACSLPFSCLPIVWHLMVSCRQYLMSSLISWRFPEDSSLFPNFLFRVSIERNGWRCAEEELRTSLRTWTVEPIKVGWMTLTEK